MLRRNHQNIFGTFQYILNLVQTPMTIDQKRTKTWTKNGQKMDKKEY